MRAIILVITFLVPGVCAAQAMCFEKAAKLAGVDRDLLVAMAIQESGMNPRAMHQNKDGTFDIGVMQINTSHLPLLKQAGLGRRDLFNACVNIMIGAILMKDCIRVEGNKWRAVGAYNAGHRTSKEETRRVYVAAVRKVYYRLKSQHRNG